MFLYLSKVAVSMSTDTADVAGSRRERVRLMQGRNKALATRNSSPSLVFTVTMCLDVPGVGGCLFEPESGQVPNIFFACGFFFLLLFLSFVYFFCSPIPFHLLCNLVAVFFFFSGFSFSSFVFVCFSFLSLLRPFLFFSLSLILRC